jgi:serine/threonine-protein kinase
MIMIFPVLKDFLKAIELNPSYANAHLFYAGAYLTPMGRHQEAIAEMKKSLDLDPLSLPLNTLMANTYFWAGEYEQSALQFKHTVDLDPTFPMAHFFYVDLLAETGKYEQAIEQAQKGELVAGASPEEAAASAQELRRAIQAGGPRGYWHKNLELTLKELHEAGAHYFPALAVALAYAKVGDNDKALEWLERSYAERDGNLTLIRSYPQFKSVHGDPRFRALTRRIGLPD